MFKRPFIIVIGSLVISLALCYFAIMHHLHYLKQSVQDTFPVAIENVDRGISVEAHKTWTRVNQAPFDIALVNPNETFLGFLRLQPAESAIQAMKSLIASNKHDNPTLQLKGKANLRIINEHHWIQIHGHTQSPKSTDVVYYTLSDKTYGTIVVFGIAEGEMTPLKETLFEEVMRTLQLKPLSEVKGTLPDPTFQDSKK